MDNKRTVILMVVLGVVMVGYYWLFSRVHQNKAWFPDPAPEQASTQPATEPTAGPATGPATGPTTLASNPAASRPSITAATSRVERVGEAKEVRLGSFSLDPQGKGTYPVGLDINPAGAGLSGVTLNEFRQQVKGEAAYTFQAPYAGVDSAAGRALATRYITINGVWEDLGSRDWGLVSSDDHSATYRVKLTVGETRLTITKRYELRPRTTPALGYEVGVTHEVVNEAGPAVKVRFYYNGPNAPLPENTRDLPEIVQGIGVEKEIAVEHAVASGYTPAKGEQTLEHKAQGPVLWSGITTAYFDAIVRPTPTTGPAFGAIKVNPLREANEEGQVFTSMLMEGPEMNLAAGAAASLPMEVYFGPKKRDVLKSAYYAVFPRSYDRTLVLTSGPCGYCTFDWLINVLVGMLWFFQKYLVHDWGLAIILLVLIVRLILHPITKRSQVSMSKMSKMGPEIERLKKKYKDEPEELNKAMMTFYKEQGATPILGCLPMFLQMPIWIALWSSLQSTFELRHAPFLWGYTWIKDLAQPDHLIRFSSPIHLFWKIQFDGINVLPILLAVVFYMQQKLQPKPVAVTPEQEQQQKMMQWMSLLFPIFLYSGPSGLNLYILTSTGIGIWEAKRIRDHIKEREEKEKQLVIVDAPEAEDRGPGAPKKSGGVQKAKQAKPAKKAGGLTGWLADLQQKAEELRNEADKKKRKGGGDR